MNAPTAKAATPSASGPLVWRDMDQSALDDAYDQLVWAPNRDQLTKRRIANSAATRARIGEPKRFAYGPTQIEGRDVYPATASGGANAASRFAIFAHGGAGRTGAAPDYGFLAEPFVN